MAIRDTGTNDAFATLNFEEILDAVLENPRLADVATIARKLCERLDDGNVAPEILPGDEDDASNDIEAIIEGAEALTGCVRSLIGRAVTIDCARRATSDSAPVGKGIAIRCSFVAEKVGA